MQLRGTCSKWRSRLHSCSDCCSSAGTPWTAAEQWSLACSPSWPGVVEYSERFSRRIQGKYASLVNEFKSVTTRDAYKVSHKNIGKSDSD